MPSSLSRPGRSVDLHPWIFGGLFALASGLLAFLAWRGFDYYSTPLALRPRHPDYWRLKPGGEWGRWYGIVGASLLVAMLSYTVRKRLAILRKVGTLRTWLSFHIFCGVTGSLLILLHTSFKFRGLVAVSFWSMVVVALSGVLGRYLYRQIPRARTGDELSLDEAQRAEAELTDRLRALGLPEAALARLEALSTAGPSGAGPSRDTGLVALLLRLPFDDLRLRWRLRGFHEQLRRELRGRHGLGSERLPPGLGSRVVALAGRKARLRRRILLWTRLQALFHYWHVLHKPFAVLMYLFLAVHVLVVTVAGYGFGAG